MAVAGAGIEEIFDTCLSAVESGRQTIDEVVARYPDQADELRPLLETAVWFSGHKVLVAPRPGFISASKSRLIGEIKQSQAAAAVQPGWLERAFGRRSWRLGMQLVLVVALLACLVLGSSGIAYAAQGSLPGDGLYPVKTGLEQVQLLVTPDTAAKIRLHMHFSQLRLAEMQELLNQERYTDIGIATDNYRQHIQVATVLLSQLAATNPLQARLLAAEMSLALQGQIILLDAMADTAPPLVRVQLEAARLAAAFNLSVVSNTQDQLRSEAAPTPTATPTASATPSPSATPTPLPSGTPTSQPTASSTPAGSQSPSPTPSPSQTGSNTPVGGITPSPTRTRTPGSGQATLTPTRTSTPRPGSTATRTPTPVTPSSTLRPGVTPSSTRTPEPTHTSTPQPPTSTSTPRPPTSTPTRQPTVPPQPTSPVPPTPPPPTPYPAPAYPPPGS
jgi:hypothetical protein